MNVMVGTSGFAFKEWKGPFYPKELKDDAMLAFYASKYPAVEINNTFYRLPREHVLQDWASRVHDRFTFSIKATQRITHFARLRPEGATALGYLLGATATLGTRLGPVLFQLPPDMAKDLERLKGFLARLPKDRRFTIEFRHDSWFDEDVFAVLRQHDVSLCIAESEEHRSPPIATASWGYLRLHRKDYENAALGQWREYVRDQRWTAAYVFFKHDYIDGSGPLAVDRFNGLFQGDGPLDRTSPSPNMGP